MATGSSKRRPAHNQPESKAGSPRAFQQVIRKAARFGCRNLQQACAAGSLAGPVGPMCTLLFFLVLIGMLPTVGGVIPHDAAFRHALDQSFARSSSPIKRRDAFGPKGDRRADAAFRAYRQDKYKALEGVSLEEDAAAKGKDPGTLWHNAVNRHEKVDRKRDRTARDQMERTRPTSAVDSANRRARRARAKKSAAEKARPAPSALARARHARTLCARHAAHVHATPASLRSAC